MKNFVLAIQKTKKKRWKRSESKKGNEFQHKTNTTWISVKFFSFQKQTRELCGGNER